MQRLEKGLMVVSFGTTHEETRQKTIDAIERQLAEAFPDRKLYRGWTSKMILRILKKRTGSTFDTVEEALERMAAEGIRDVLVQPTHIISGEENDKMRATIEQETERFELVRVGQTLLDRPADLTRLAKILADQLLHAPCGNENACGAEDVHEADRLLILMGHGSAEKPEANQIYHDLQKTFLGLGYGNILVATVEGTPAFRDVLRQLAESEGENRQKTVVLAPLMIVAGDHAKSDMAGEGEESWKNQLQARRFDVIPVLKGLGEYPQVREMIAEHAKAAEAE